MPLLQRLLPGLGLIAALSVAVLMTTQSTVFSRYGIGPLTLAIIVGTVMGNTMPALGQGSCRAGIQFAQSRLLRLGVALYGLNLSMQEIAQVGSRGILIDLLMVVSTLALGWFVGTRLFKLDTETALLTAAGSAICGAAAIVATAPMLDMPQEKRAQTTSVAVATVVIFGSLAMLLYPVLYALAGWSKDSFGVYVGSTVHEVAQVVAIGSMIGGVAAHSAVIVKMIRVLLLIPFLLYLSFSFRSNRQQGIAIPWFAIAFLSFTVINSFALMPAQLREGLGYLGLFSLTAAMAALGLDTNLKRFRQSGLQAVSLGLCLFGHLTVVGGFVNYWLGK